MGSTKTRALRGLVAAAVTTVAALGPAAPAGAADRSHEVTGQCEVQGVDRGGTAVTYIVEGATVAVSQGDPTAVTGVTCHVYVSGQLFRSCSGLAPGSVATTSCNFVGPVGQVEVLWCGDGLFFSGRRVTACEV